MLTSKLFNLPDLKAIVESAQAANKARGVQVIGTQILNPAAANAGRGGGGGRGGPPPFTADEAAVIDTGRQGLQGAVLHLPRAGRPRRAAGRRSGRHDHGAVAGRLAARAWDTRDYVIKTLLHGMTGPLDGKTYPAGVMMPLGANDDRVDRRDRVVRAQQLRQPRARSSRRRTSRACAPRPRARKTLWTPEELEASVPRVHGGAADLEGDGEPQRRRPRAAR